MGNAGFIIVDLEDVTSSQRDWYKGPLIQEHLRSPIATRSLDRIETHSQYKVGKVWESGCRALEGLLQQPPKP